MTQDFLINIVWNIPIYLTMIWIIQINYPAWTNGGYNNENVFLVQTVLYKNVSNIDSVIYWTLPKNHNWSLRPFYQWETYHNLKSNQLPIYLDHSLYPSSEIYLQLMVKVKYRNSGYSYQHYVIHFINKISWDQINVDSLWKHVNNIK